MNPSAVALESLLGTNEPALYDIATSAAGPQGKLPLSDEMLRTWSSGDLFGLSQAAGMGWKPEDLLGPQFLILSTQGGVRQGAAGDDDRPGGCQKPSRSNRAWRRDLAAQRR